MGLTSALNTSLNGLSLNETSIDVIGNNIANAGTNGFKASTVRFATQLSRTLSVGSAPNPPFSGGTNPLQIGLGADVAAISRDFTQGSISNSTSPYDLAIQGEGFFILDGPNGRVYSRNGNFSRNSAADLVNDQGMFVQGYAVDDDFNLITTQLSNLNIPIGVLNVAQQTTEIALTGALFPTGEIATQGSVNLSEVLTDTSTGLPATGGSLLADLENESGVPLFDFSSSSQQTVTFTPRKGGRRIESVDFLIDETLTDLDALMTYFDEVLAIQSGGTIPPDGGTLGQPGVDVVGGQITIVGNSGEVNAIEIGPGDLLADGQVVPISFQESQEADGHSTGTDFVVYDSLGQAVNVRLTAVLEGSAPGETTYRWYLESAEDSGDDVAIATGQLTFDSLGNVSGGDSVNFSLQRDDTAAVSPMQIEMDLSQISGISSEAAGSLLILNSQDGSPPGTLQSFVIDENGIINGVFDNGNVNTLGQVILARFANPDGLIEDGSTTFREGVSSGVPALTNPGTFGVGTIRAGAIELSNTDIGKNLVELIVASTNYRGNARVISSVQQLVDELLVLGR